MTKLIYPVSWKYGKPTQVKIMESKKPLFYLKKELEFIDFSETTAWSNWADIKFIGEKTIYTEDCNRFKFKKIEFKGKK